MLPLRSLALRTPAVEHAHEFPYSVPSIRSLPRLTFPSAVTFLVGENGSGKSTLLEGLASATGLPSIGSELSIEADDTLQAQRALASAIKLTWNRAQSRRGFFLRAEDFFGFTKTVARLRAGFLAEMADVNEQYRDRSDLARTLRAGPIAASLRAMEARYGTNLDAQSHGESFLSIFQSRFVPGGLHLLDEPEAPLSPQSQLGLMAMLTEMAAQGTQFIIATHSPILLAFPGATIYSFDGPPVHQVEYEELEHVRLTRDFLASPERFLRHL